jgi:hypothetical protein
MKKPKFNPNFPSTLILIYAICLGLAMLALGVSNIPNVRDGLASGRIYSVGIILNDKSMIYRGSSPKAYWIMMGLYIFSCVACIGLGTLAPILTIKAFIQKLVRQKKERDSQ